MNITVTAGTQNVNWHAAPNQVSGLLIKNSVVLCKHISETQLKEYERTIKTSEIVN